VWRIEPGKKPAVFATGFSNVTGVAVDANGNVYVGELVKDFAKAEKGDLTGSVYKVASDGTRSELAKGKLKAVGGVAVGPDGAIYVSVMSVLPHGGQIVRVAA
jgi:glucose/arabinose dehydrogenase